MLTSLHIKNFRGFRDLTIGPLARVNLIAGKNNAGKTGVLEALFLLFPSSRLFSLMPSTFRSSLRNRDDLENYWKWLPYKKENQNYIEITGDANPPSDYSVRQNESWNESNTRIVAFEWKKNNQVKGNAHINTNGVVGADFPSDLPKVSIFSTQHSVPTEDADVFNALVLKKKKKRLIELLKLIDPLIEDIQYLKISEQPLVYVDYQGLTELIPLTQLGQGIARLFRFYSEMLLAESKIILIDEIENGIHHSALSLVWQGLAEIARKEDLQIFATTHSYECIAIAQEAFSKAATPDFALHRLEKTSPGDIQAVTYDGDSLSTSLELEWEVR